MIMTTSVTSQAHTTKAPEAVQIQQAYSKLGDGENDSRKSSMQQTYPRAPFPNQRRPFRGRGRGGRGGRGMDRSFSRPHYQSAPVYNEIKEEIIGHSDQANQSAASTFKTLMEDEDQPSSSEPVPDHPHLVPVVDQPRVSQSSQDALMPFLEASLPPTLLVNRRVPLYQREYSSERQLSLIAHDEGGKKEDAWQQQQNHILIGQPSHSQSYKTESENTYPAARQYSKEFSAAPSTAAHSKRSSSSTPHHNSLLLQGLGEGRARNKYGKSLFTGHPSASDTHTTTVIGDAGCDIPMVREQWKRGTTQVEKDGSEEVKATIGPHHISLDPDLPPLAIEHPARVWNSMIHSLGTALQPVIKWDYEKVQPLDGAREPLWLAHLTLVLPPTHPTIQDHPLYRTLPKNRFKREYVGAVEVLGGIKKWTGEPKKLKTDAQNTTLVKCIAESALDWVLAPDGLNVLPASDGENDDEDTTMATYQGAKARAQELFHPTPKRALEDSSYFDKLEANASTFGVNRTSQDEEGATKNTDEIAIDDTDADATPEETAGSRILIRQGKLGDPDPNKQDQFIEGSPMQQLLEILDKTIGPNGLNLPSPISLTTSWDPLSGKHSCVLVIGTIENSQTYQVDSLHDSSSAAQDAVCQRAIDLNALGFLQWLHESLAPLVAKSVDRTVGDGYLNNPAGHNPKQDYSGVDWQKQLETFCEESGLPPPKYGQRIERNSTQQVMFIGQLTLEDEVFSAPTACANIREARQSVARFVFSDHFGQEFKSMAV